MLDVEDVEGTLLMSEKDIVLLVALAEQRKLEDIVGRTKKLMA